MNMDYKDYWENGVWENREKRKYYKRLYWRVKDKIVVPKNTKVLDVGGGNGQLMFFLGIENNVDIIDVSDSGLECAKKAGFNFIKADIQKIFPVKNNSYDNAFCFEVLEHLHAPEITTSEISRILKPGGMLYVGQPNMRADGVHHVRRFYKKDIINLLQKCGFEIEWIDYVPAFTMREAIVDDIVKTKSVTRKIKQCVAYILSFLPERARYLMARCVPNRFALLFIIKAKKRKL